MRSWPRDPVYYFESYFNFTLIYQSYILSLVFLSLSLVLSTYYFPVLIFCFYLYLNLCLAREFTYRHIRNVIRLALLDVSSTGGRVCGVRADLGSLVLVSCGCA